MYFQRSDITFFLRLFPLYGGVEFLGLILSDVSDYYIDNFRFSNLWNMIFPSITVFVSESRKMYAIFPFSAMKIGQISTSTK